MAPTKDKVYGEEHDVGKAYGRHIILETIKHKAELPHWVDVLIVQVIGLVHGLLFLGGMGVSAMGIALSAGVAPSWTSGVVSSMGSAVMAATGTAIYALSIKRPDLLSIAMYGLVGLIGWVSCVATVLYILGVSGRVNRRFRFFSGRRSAAAASCCRTTAAHHCREVPGVAATQDPDITWLPTSAVGGRCLAPSCKGSAMAAAAHISAAP